MRDLPRASQQYSRWRIMIKNPNNANHGATYLEDEDGFALVFNNRIEAEDYIKKDLICKD